MNKENIQRIFTYNQWANARILDTAAQLTREEFLAPGAFPHGALREVLVHILFAEWIWRKRWDGVSPRTRLNPEDFPTLESLRARWKTEDEALMTFTARVTDDQLNRPFQYTSTEGVKYENILWESMAHVVNHGTQHRSEVAVILTELGHSPGDLDMILYFRKKL